MSLKSNHDRFDAEQLEFESKLKAVSDAVWSLAHSREGNNLALLSLLRTLEGLHQEIRDSLFQESLPDSRQGLYSLLKDIEASGGWPYIHRMKLRSLLTKFQDLPDGDVTSVFTRLDPPNTTESLD
ncbi:MAG: hypothetical protein KME45_23865 [Stenomitos rutilans HA7619-LM2]|jgi:hypothetical protein|nr:hypothetical protein [Stenomitos rutilans HA7619-LM2]